VWVAGLERERRKPEHSVTKSCDKVISRGNEERGARGRREASPSL